MEILFSLNIMLAFLLGRIAVEPAQGGLEMPNASKYPTTNPFVSEKYVQ